VPAERQGIEHKSPKVACLFDGKPLGAAAQLFCGMAALAVSPPPPLVLPAMPSRSRRSRQGENPLEPIDPEPLTTRKLVERRELRSAADRGFDTLIVPVQEHFLLLARRSDTVPGEKPGPGGAATDAELTYAKRVSELPKSVASNTLTKATGTRPYSGGRPPARSPTSRVGPAETCCSCAGCPCWRPCPICGLVDRYMLDVYPIALG